MSGAMSRSGSFDAPEIITCVVQELLPDADKELKEYLAYPLEATMASPEVADVVSDDFPQVANAALQAYESGKLQEALESGADGFKVPAPPAPPPPRFRSTQTNA